MWFITTDGVALAYACLAALCGAAVGIYVLYRGTERTRLLRRIRANVCHRCGYDLRENTHRCSECGAFIESTPERVDALAHVTADAPPPPDDDDVDLTGTDPSSGSPPSPG